MEFFETAGENFLIFWLYSRIFQQRFNLIYFLFFLPINFLQVFSDICILTPLKIIFWLFFIFDMRFIIVISFNYFSSLVNVNDWLITTFLERILKALLVLLFFILTYNMRIVHWWVFMIYMVRAWFRVLFF